MVVAPAAVQAKTISITLIRWALIGVGVHSYRMTAPTQTFLMVAILVSTEEPTENKVNFQTFRLEAVREEECISVQTAPTGAAPFFVPAKAAAGWGECPVSTSLAISFTPVCPMA